MRQPTHAIFDLDGVLLDSEPIYRGALEQVLARYGRHYPEALARELSGRSGRELAAEVVERLGLELEPRRLLAERDALLVDALPNAALLPGAVELLTALSSRGIPLALATSSRRALVARKLSRHDVQRAFEVMVYGDDPEIERAKPAPDIFLVAARRLGVAPEQCVVFEDSVSGVRAAHYSGMQVVACIPRGNDPAQFSAATLIVHSLLDVSLADLGL